MLESIAQFSSNLGCYRKSEHRAANEGNEKDSFTVAAAITAARMKLPVTLIGSGKTDAVEASDFGDVGFHRTDHSESGWTTTETFQRWLAWLRSLYDDGGPLWLILDCYSVYPRKPGEIRR
jgi:hypothetical protein